MSKTPPEIKISDAVAGQVERRVMPMLPMGDAPTGEFILLSLPEFGASAATWWPGCWSHIHNCWHIRTPYTLKGKMVMVRDIPEPIGFQWMPEA